MQHIRRQRTIAQPAEVQGIGFLTGADVRVRFLPAPADFGLVFRRTDVPLAPPIPALIEFTVPRERRTALQRDGLTIEMTEHVLAALAGLRIDNCIIELDAAELPGLDGSSLAYVTALRQAGALEQKATRGVLVISEEVTVKTADGQQSLRAEPSPTLQYEVEYALDYGRESPIHAQTYQTAVTPETFAAELAFARTFVLEFEARALRAQGYGSRTTTQDLLIFGPQGVIDNSLRAVDECARHKALDCVGDLALLGCDIVGRICAQRSGHRLNLELVKALQRAVGRESRPTPWVRAA